MFFCLLSVAAFTLYSFASFETHSRTRCKLFLRHRIAVDVPKRKLHEINSLRIGTLNLSDFYFEGNREGLNAPKTPKQIEMLANSILKSKADILVLQEVVNAQAFDEFLWGHLEDKYDQILMRTNDPEGRAIAILIKKDLPLDVKALTHQSERWQPPYSDSTAPTFTRDFPIFEFRTTDQAPESTPLFMVAGVHFLRFIPNDPARAAKKREEVTRSSEILAEYQNHYPTPVPIIVAGDFNSNLSNPSMFTEYKNQGFKDTAALVGNSVDYRATHASGGQIDGLFVNSVIAGNETQPKLVQNTVVHPYVNEGVVMRPGPDLPQGLPSTHFLVTSDLTFQKLLAKVPGQIPPAPHANNQKTQKSSKAKEAKPKTDAPQTTAPTNLEIASQLNQFVEKVFFDEGNLRLPDPSKEEEKALAHLVESAIAHEEFWPALDVDTLSLIVEKYPKGAPKKEVTQVTRDPYIETLELSETNKEEISRIQISRFAQEDIANLSAKDKKRIYEEAFLKIALAPGSAIWNHWGTSARMGSIRINLHQVEYRVIFDTHNNQPRIIMVDTEELKGLQKRVDALAN